ncbi:o-succinylbenzoate synthase [Crocinitomix catalasitica]|uniref:o-succinylbenzoate synthase n=1 Tax=Crocinitomix catalasitica TaxID=184607 RepID=UPI00068478BA|nr:o-succinylbenzoate synthase [Crocinitomix catalasitica]
MYAAKFVNHKSIFKQASGTSRGVLTEKDSWILSLWKTENELLVGKGEASIIKTLSPDWNELYIDKLNSVAANINDHIENDLVELTSFPSILFAIETALLDLKNGGDDILFPSAFTDGKASIPINGLIWMGEYEKMRVQIIEKLAAGYKCIKLKIGAIDFESELRLIASIRNEFNEDQIEIRVDANGAFSPEEAMDKLKRLASLNIHSIEQPIKQGQHKEMAELCLNTPLAIALDEELIGITGYENKLELLTQIKPQYIILKPSLIGGLRGTNEWIKAAEEFNIKWWITSALETNIGLNAIAQYTFTKNNPLPQGLGTGQLFTNNFDSNLTIENGTLIHLSKRSN